MAEVAQLTKHHPATTELFLDTAPGTGFRRPVLAAPIAAALISNYAIATPPRVQFEIASLRSFDKRWFDDAHRLALTLLLGRRMAQHPDPLET